MSTNPLMIKDLCDAIAKSAEDICRIMKVLPMESKVEMLNHVRLALHEVSPFKNDPIDCVLWALVDGVVPNDYNPNDVAPPEMRSLRYSVEHSGYTQPIVTDWTPVDDLPAESSLRDFPHTDTRIWRFVVVDGEHRQMLAREATQRRRLHGYAPITLIRNTERSEERRISATIHHNGARGEWVVKDMGKLVARLFALGMNDDEVGTALSMDADEVLRFKVQTGIAGLFKNQPYGKGWE